MTIKAASNASLASVSLRDCEKNLAPVKSNERAVSWPQEAEPVWLVKARTFARQREPDKAMQLLLTLVRADPQNILAWRELARLLDGAGRRDRQHDELTGERPGRLVRGAQTARYTNRLNR